LIVPLQKRSPIRHGT